MAAKFEKILCKRARKTKEYNWIRLLLCSIA